MQRNTCSALFFLCICSSFLSTHEKRTHLDFAENIKDPAPGTNPCWAHLSIKNFSRHNPPTDDLPFGDDISDRTMAPLSAGCAKNYQWDICRCVWDMVVVSIDPCRDEINEQGGRQGQSREGNGIRSFKFDFRQAPSQNLFLYRKSDCCDCNWLRGSCVKDWARW